MIHVTQCDTYENQSNANNKEAASGGIPIAVNRIMMVTKEPLGIEGTAQDISETRSLQEK